VTSKKFIVPECVVQPCKSRGVLNHPDYPTGMVCKPRWSSDVETNIAALLKLRKINTLIGGNANDEADDGSGHQNQLNQPIDEDSQPAVQRRPLLRLPGVGTTSSLPPRVPPYAPDVGSNITDHTNLGFNNLLNSRRAATASSFSLPSHPPTDLNRISSWSSTFSAEVPPSALELGLHLVQNAPDPTADLILVHGLGGSWMKTWAWNRDPGLFWPLWLTSDTTLSKLRVFSFGYNANFRGPNTSLGILDFAKDLLFKMSGWFGDREERIGQVRLC
jgi:hypothetical protein